MERKRISSHEENVVCGEIPSPPRPVASSSPAKDSAQSKPLGGHTSPTSTFPVHAKPQLSNSHDPTSATEDALNRCIPPTSRSFDHGTARGRRVQIPSAAASVYSQPRLSTSADKPLMPISVQGSHSQPALQPNNWSSTPGPSPSQGMAGTGGTARPPLRIMTQPSPVVRPRVPVFDPADMSHYSASSYSQTAFPSSTRPAPRPVNVDTGIGHAAFSTLGEEDQATNSTKPISFRRALSPGPHSEGSGSSPSLLESPSSGQAGLAEKNLVVGYLDVTILWARTKEPQSMVCVVGQKNGQYYVSTTQPRATRAVWQEPCTFIVTDTSTPFHFQVNYLFLLAPCFRLFLMSSHKYI